MTMALETANMNNAIETKLFKLGQVVMTQGINQIIEPVSAGRVIVMGLLNRHQAGDWGDLDSEDKTANDNAVHGKDRILSSYNLLGFKVWVITEWDRSVTTILLPSEY